MPELPEVETTRRGIAPAVCGRKLREVTVREGRLRQPVPADLAATVAGAELRAVRRRGKYLLFDFDHGSVLLHLGMSGSLRVVEADSEPGRHDHVDLVFGSDAVLRYRDPRRFGLILWQAGAAEVHPLLAHLGIEPLAAEFDGAWLFAATRGSKVAIKSWLMDAHRVVGVGTSMRPKACSARASIRSRPPAISGARAARGWRMPCRTHCVRRSRWAAAVCATTSAAMARKVISCSKARSMAAPANLAGYAARRSSARCWHSVLPTGARVASGCDERAMRVCWICRATHLPSRRIAGVVDWMPERRGVKA